jgi:hypothetical protein
MQVTNNTGAAVSFFVGSGRVEAGTAEPYSSALIGGNYPAGETLYPLFSLMLTKTYKLDNLRPLKASLFYQYSPGGSLSLNDVPILADRNIYIVLDNRGGVGGVSVSSKKHTLLTRLDKPGGEINVGSGDEALFRINPKQQNVMTLASPTVVPFEQVVYQAGWVYHFVFNGKKVMLQDARPLNRVGEKGWVKTLDNATSPVLLCKAGPVTLEQSTGVVWTAALDCGNGGIIASGYNSAAGGGLHGCLDVFNVNGSLNTSFQSTNKEAYSSCVLSLAGAGSNSAFLAAGGMDMQGFGSYQPWAGIITDLSSGRYTVELAPKDFPATWGNAAACAWDAEAKLWRLAGSLIPQTDALGSSAKGAWLCTVDAAGKIADKRTLPNVVINTLLCAGKDWYVIGEDDTAARGQALVISYDETGKERWRKNDLTGFSYYQCAAPARDGSIVLGGVMAASSDDGTGGKPFLEALDPATGREKWIANLGQSPKAAGCVLATSVIPAPDFGYYVALCGVKKGNFAKPFVIMRVNERGILYEN